MKIGYIRLSTTEKSENIQNDALVNAGCKKIYKDKGFFDRKKLETCIKSLHKGDYLIIWKLDRLGRSSKDLFEIIDDLNKRGIEFVSLTEKIDTSSNRGKLIFDIFSSIAEFERSIISERTIEGLTTARKQGSKGGRPKKLDKNKIKLARKMLSNPDVSVTEVANHFGIARNTLYRNLND